MDWFLYFANYLRIKPQPAFNPNQTQKHQNSLLHHPLEDDEYRACHYLLLKEKIIFGRGPFFRGSLCIRKFAVGVGVRCGSVCGCFFAAEEGEVEKRGIYCRVYSS